MFKFVFIFLACLPFLSFAQEQKDSEIIVVPRDTANVYSQVENLPYASPSILFMLA